MGAVREKLVRCKNALVNWNRGKLSYEEDIKQLTTQLEVLQRHETPNDRGEICHIQGQIEKGLEQVNLKWKQCAKQSWYQKDDWNTHFFHAWASQCRRNNTISSIKEKNGSVWSEEADIHSALIAYYKQLFTSGGERSMAECMEGLEGRVNAKMNDCPFTPFMTEEMEHALKHMCPLKSPGRMDSLQGSTKTHGIL